MFSDPRSPIPRQHRHGVALLLIAFVAVLAGTGAKAGDDSTTSARNTRLQSSQTYDQIKMERIRATRPQEANAEPVRSLPTRLTWRAPMTREDGSSLYPGEIYGYRIYVKAGTSKTTRTIPVNDASRTSLSLDQFSPGAYQFSISTVDTDGLESRRSAIISVATVSH